MGRASLILAVILAGIIGYAAASLQHMAAPSQPETVTVTTTTATTRTVTVTETVTTTVQGVGQHQQMNPEEMRSKLEEELKRECSTCHAPPSVDEREVIPGPQRKPIEFSGRSATS